MGAAASVDHGHAEKICKHQGIKLSDAQWVDLAGDSGKTVNIARLISMSHAAPQPDATDQQTNSVLPMLFDMASMKFSQQNKIAVAFTPDSTLLHKLQNERMVLRDVSQTYSHKLTLDPDFGHYFMRKDLLSDQFVIFAPLRKKEKYDKPRDYDAGAVPTQTHQRKSSSDRCPFCADTISDPKKTGVLMSYDETEKDVDSALCIPHMTRKKEGSSNPWRVLVVQNKYPYIVKQDDPVICSLGERIQLSSSGTMEVVIEHPCHNRCLALLTREHVAVVIRSFLDRGRILEKERKELRWLSWHQNHGPTSGGSLTHPHSQIIGLPLIPNMMRKRLLRNSEHFEHSGQTLLESEIHEAEKGKAGQGTVLDSASRIIQENQAFVAYVPFAAENPYRCRIVPKRRCPSFLSITDKEHTLLADILRDVLRRLYIHLDDPDYNFCIRSSPINLPVEMVSFHWYLTIHPHIYGDSGFQPLGLAYNTHFPANDAAALRDVDLCGKVSRELPGFDFADDGVPVS